MSVLFYRRPYTEPSNGPLRKNECQLLVEKLYSNRKSIPEALSFDNVVEQKTLPPCSLSDFMAYLIYVTHNAENLQFYLWVKDYTKRFSALKLEDQALSPPWKFANLSCHIKPSHTNNPLPKNDSDAPIELVNMVKPIHNPLGMIDFNTFRHDQSTEADFPSPVIIQSIASNASLSEVAENAVTAAGFVWQPFSIQPFRDEITMAVAHYIAQGGPRELNLSHRDRTGVLHALQHTTHPSAFDDCLNMVEASLVGESHPNFIRWSICNGNKPTVVFVRVCGVLTTLLGFLSEMILAMSYKSRGMRVIPTPFLFIGITTLISSYKGLCMVLYSRGHMRRLRPWEEATLSSPDTSNCAQNLSNIGNYDEEASVLTGRFRFRGGIGKQNNCSRAFEDFGPANDFGDEQWVQRHSKKCLCRKVFDDFTWVQEPGIRETQNKIVCQSLMWGAILTFLTTAYFVALPKGNLIPL